MPCALWLIIYLFEGKGQGQSNFRKEREKKLRPHLTAVAANLTAAAVNLAAAVVNLTAAALV